MHGETTCLVCGEEFVSREALAAHVVESHDRMKDPLRLGQPSAPTARRIFGTLGALIVLYIAISGALIVDWGAMISGDAERVKNEVGNGSGLWGVLSLLLFYASYRIGRWAWRVD